MSEGVWDRRERQAPKEKVAKERTSSLPKRHKMSGKDKRFWVPRGQRLQERKAVILLFDGWVERGEGFTSLEDSKRKHRESWQKRLN
jgi:hypothetical protein